MEQQNIFKGGERGDVELWEGVTESEKKNTRGGGGDMGVSAGVTAKQGQDRSKTMMWNRQV